MVGVARGHQRADTLRPYSQKTSQSNHTRTTDLSNSMKLSHACGATQDRRVMVERSDRACPLEKGMASHFSILALRTSWTVWKGKMIGYWKRNSPGQHATGDQWRNNPRKNEGMEPKQKQYPAVDVTGDWLCQSLWLCGSQSTVENSERDGNTRPPNLPLEKSVCRSGSNS